MLKYHYQDIDIAIVAMGSIFPNAPETEIFWQNILNKKCSIKEVGSRVLDKEIFYRPEVRNSTNKMNKSYCNLAASVDESAIRTHNKKFLIPPAVAEQMDITQHAIVYCVDKALQNIKGKQLPKERTAMIFGNALGGTRYVQCVELSYHQIVESVIKKSELLNKKLSKDEIEMIAEELSVIVNNRTMPITEDTAPGVLPNVVAGRVANIFNLWGPAYTVDAACASSHAAVISSIQGLLNRQFDAVVTGASDIGLGEWGLIMFSAINALSPEGSFPFDARANGFVMGQGAAAVVLKRMGDAIRDNDNILGVISGYGWGSDGKGKYIAAPSEDGQVRVISDACKMANFHVDTIEMIEAHGTGTTVGDTVEIASLKKAFSALGASKENYCGVGSVKSNIGHLKSAAGAAGLIKTVLALNNKILPPTANVENVNPKLKLEGSPFYILKDAKPWQETKEHPRRASVSAFGFGGANYQLALQEFRPEFYSSSYFISAQRSENAAPNFTEIENKSCQSEVILLWAENIEGLKKSYENFIKSLSENKYKNFSNAVFNHNIIADSKVACRLAILASSEVEVQQKWANFLNAHKNGTLSDKLLMKDICFGQDHLNKNSKLAMLFPGQASQYPNMLKGLISSFALAKSIYDTADAYWQQINGHTISSLVFGDDANSIDKILKETQNTHPAVFLCDYIMFRLLKESGLRADYLIGHSLGEIAALAAGGVLEFRDALKLVSSRGYAFSEIDKDKRGKMLSVKTDYDTVKKRIDEFGKGIYISNINSAEQVIVSGLSEDIEKFSAFLEQKKAGYVQLNVSHAFHSPLMEEAALNFSNKLSKINFMPAQTKIIANHLQSYYPTDGSNSGNVAELLKEQVVSPVWFVQSVQKLYDEGVRVFVEAGPGTVLTNLVKSILIDKPDVKVFSSNSSKKDDLEVFNKTVGELFAAGADIHTLTKREGDNINTVVKEVVRFVEKKADEISFDAVRPVQPAKDVSLVYSGVSIGLPGSFKKAFSDDNFDRIFRGDNMIEKLTDDELQSILDLNLTRVIKSEKGAIFKSLETLNEVIQLSGKFGKLDMVNDYLIDEKTLKQMTLTVSAAVAAGYEALKDAGIPLVHEYTVTSSGAKLPTRLALPISMQNDTGIIFSNGFPIIEPFIEEVSKFVASKYGRKTRMDMIEFYESIISRISDYTSKKILTDWFALHYSRLNSNPGEEDVYKFNHNFMSLVASQANNRLAQFIGAKGPNFQINAACSSTAYALTLAESLIKTNQAGRMIIIGADTPSSKLNLPWLGAGFLCTGAATNSGDLSAAALPFDNKRNGMIMGAGAVGIILEKEDEIKERGMHGICRLLGTQAFNLAGHQTKIDSGRFSVELDKFITRMEKQHSISRDTIAAKTMYLSHEPYTPKEGGCSQTEKISLEYAFKEHYKEILVCNTKGFTGHTMGASIEEAVAAKALQHQKVPPVANYKDPDPELSGLKISSGGSYPFNYVIRMIAGFGGQGNFNMLQKIADGNDRIADKTKYQTWIKNAANSDSPTVKENGRILVAENAGAPLKHISETKNEAAQTQVLKDDYLTSDKVNPLEREIKRPENIGSSSGLNKKKLTQDIIEIFSSVTKYPADMLDITMEMEADLGIDTVKQATILSIIAKRFGIEENNNISLSEYPTIGQLIDLIVSFNPEFADIEIEEEIVASKNEDTALAFQGKEYDSDIEQEVIRIFSEVTKYPADMLDVEMEMEADLGIDTVKQATIMTILANKYGLSEENAISELPRIKDIIEMILKKVNISERTLNKSSKEDLKVKLSESKVLVNAQASENEVRDAVIKIFSEVTKYPADMLDVEMEMEADLGIDTVKQATIMTILANKYGLSEENAISELPRIKDIIEMILKKVNISKASIARSAEEILPKPMLDNRMPLRSLDPKDDLRDEVIKIISDITKYPAEMLDGDMEIEADLGIDTVKQATILSILAKKIGINPESVQVSEFNTINQLIEMIKNNHSTVVKPSGKETDKRMEVLKRDGENENLSELELPWLVPVPFEKPIERKNFSLSEKSVLIIGNSEDLINKLLKKIALITKNVSSLNFKPDSENSDIKIRVDELLQKAKTPDIIVDCGIISESATSNDENTKNTTSCVEKRFAFYKSLPKEVIDNLKRMVCLVAMDGAMCCGPLLQEPISVDHVNGAISGFYKGFNKEFENIAVKIVDIGSNDQVPGVDILSKIICDEIEAEGEEYEIAYKKGIRSVIKLSNVESEDIHPNCYLFDNAHFLITGGALGITAEVAKEIAKRIPGRFTLIGRTSLPDNIEELSKLDELRLQQKKLDIMEQMKKKYASVNMIQVDAEYEKIVNAVIAYRTIEEIKVTGSSCIYLTCDVRDEEALKACIAKARKQNGDIDVIVHGAGIEKSNFLHKKSFDEFNRVFDTKVQGALNLEKTIDLSKTKALIAFSSISGRLGNEAQLDYCAANNFINVWVRNIKVKFPGIHAVSIDWSGWKQTGMALKNEYVKKNGERLGLFLIEPKAGANEFMKVLTGSFGSTEVLISKGLGDKAKGFELRYDYKKYAMVDWVLMNKGEVSSAYKVISIKRDEVVNQHRMKDAPIVPAVGLMEISAEFHALVKGWNSKYCFKNIEIFSPIKLFHEQPKEICTSGKKLSEDTMEITISSWFNVKNSNIVNKLDHCRMQISNTLGEYKDLNIENWNFDSSTMTCKGKRELYDLNREEFKNNVFLGELFYECSLGDHNNLYYDEERIILPSRLPEVQIGNEKYPLEKMLINPCFTDSVYQGAAQHCQIVGNGVYIPLTVEEFGVVDVPRETGLYKVYAKTIAANETDRSYNIAVFDNKGAIRYYARNAVFRKIGF